MFKVIISTALALVVSIPSLASAEQTKSVAKDIPVYFANNVKNDLSKEDISKITSQLGPTAKSVTIVESAPIVNSTNQPNLTIRGPVCEESAVFRNVSQVGSYVFKLATSGTRYVNKTGSNLTYTSTITEAKSVNGEVNYSGKIKWGPVENTVGFKIGGSITWTTSEATTIIIRPHYQGWNDYGALNDYWTGYYANVLTNCSEVDGAYINVNGPRQKAVVANETWANY